MSTPRTIDGLDGVAVTLAGQDVITTRRYLVTGAPLVKTKHMFYTIRPTEAWVQFDGQTFDKITISGDRLRADGQPNTRHPYGCEKWWRVADDLPDWAWALTDYSYGREDER